MNDEKVRQRAAQFVKKNMKKEQDAWYVGQKCEIYDDQVGWTWCEIKEIFTDGEGEWIKIYYTIYDYSRMNKLDMTSNAHNLAKHKKFNVPMGHKGLGAILPPDIAPYLKHKYNTLCQRIEQYPQQSLDEHLDSRYTQLNTMSMFYKSKNIEAI